MNTAAQVKTGFESDSSTLMHFIHRNMLRMKFIMGSLPG
jgi:hypothetical protein